MMRLSTRTILLLITFLQFYLIKSFQCHSLLGNAFARFKAAASSSTVNTLTAQQQHQQLTHHASNTKHNTAPQHQHNTRRYLFQEPNNGESPEDAIIEGAIGVRSFTKYIIPVAAIAGIALLTAATSHIDITQMLAASVQRIEELGPYGYLYFAMVYIAAELLAIPVFPLTASSGYLFGLLPGTLLVVGCATIAASISFFIGRTFLRDWAQQYIQKSEIWRLVDKVIAKEGFKFVLLLRLSPLLPFAVANYLYAVTSVDFWSFIAATFLGFLPGSFGFVYFGNAGKEIFSASQSAMPWYMYAGIGALIIALGKTFATIAMNAVNEIKKEEEEKQRTEV